MAAASQKLRVGASLARPPMPFRHRKSRPNGAGPPTSVIKSVPKSRFYDSFSLKGEAFGGNFNSVSYHRSALDSGQGFSPLRGRSCQPLALRNQWLTDVGGRRRRQGGDSGRHLEINQTTPSMVRTGSPCPAIFRSAGPGSPRWSSRWRGGGPRPRREAAR